MVLQNHSASHFQIAWDRRQCSIEGLPRQRRGPHRQTTHSGGHQEHARKGRPRDWSGHPIFYIFWSQEESSFEQFVPVPSGRERNSKGEQPCLFLVATGFSYRKGKWNCFVVPDSGKSDILIMVINPVKSRILLLLNCFNSIFLWLCYFLFFSDFFLCILILPRGWLVVKN